VHPLQGSGGVTVGLRHPGRVFAATAVAVVIADQSAKVAARSGLTLQQSVPLVPGLLKLTYVHNTGAAFGLLPGKQPLFILTSLLVLFVVAVYWRRARPSAWPVVIALALVAGGAVGNLIDRAIVGQVTDFLEFAFVSFPVFNIADASIFVGVGILMAWLLFGPTDEPVGDSASPASEGDDRPTADGAGASR
jgi:signal peptidase II